MTQIVWVFIFMLLLPIIIRVLFKSCLVLFIVVFFLVSFNFCISLLYITLVMSGEWERNKKKNRLLEMKTYRVKRKGDRATVWFYCIEHNTKDMRYVHRLVCNINHKHVVEYFIFSSRNLFKISLIRRRALFVSYILSLLEYKERENKKTKAVTRTTTTTRLFNCCHYSHAWISVASSWIGTIHQLDFFYIIEKNYIYLNIEHWRRFLCSFDWNFEYAQFQVFFFIFWNWNNWIYNELTSFVLLQPQGMRTCQSVN